MEDSPAALKLRMIQLMSPAIVPGARYLLCVVTSAEIDSDDSVTISKNKSPTVS